jgi:hypothetical protein
MRVSLEYLFTPAEETNLRKDVLNIYDAYSAHSVVLIVWCMVWCMVWLNRLTTCVLYFTTHKLEKLYRMSSDIHLNFILHLIFMVPYILVKCMFD